MIFNIIGGSAALFSIVAVMSGHPWTALATCAIGIPLCLLEIHHRDNPTGKE